MKRLLLVLCGVLCSLPVSAAVTVRNVTKLTGTGTSPTAVEPTGCTSGDMLVALAESDTSAITQPTGWTQDFTGTQGALHWSVSHIARAGSAPSLVWTVTGSVYREVHLACLMPATGTVAFDSKSAAGTSGNGASSNPNPPATTAVASASLAIAGGLNDAGAAAGGWTASAGYTMKTGTALQDSGFLETKTLSAAGSEDPAAVANAPGSTTDFWNGFTMTFAESGGGGAAVVPQRMLIGVGI